MNEEPPPPFDTVGDESVEARIVAWVLGETSAFEAAELERLCEERPELLVFRRRMRALHGLLTEAEAAEKDHSWKLSAEKRQVLDEIFGEEKATRLEPHVIRPEAHNDRSIRRSGRRALLAIAACLILTIIVAKVIGPITRISPIDSTKNVVFEQRAASPSRTDSLAASQELAKAIRDQEDKVEERRKVLSTIVRTKGIIYKGQDSFHGQLGVDEDQGARSALQTFNQLEKERTQLETQLQTLNESNVDSQTKANSQAQLEMANDRLKNVEVMKDDSREESIKRGLDAQDYADAKRDFESDQQLLQAMKLKQIELSIAKNRGDESFARIDAPATVSAPSTPPEDGSYRLESKQSQSNRELGMLKTKEQSMLAKSPAKPASRVAASAAPAQTQLPPPADSSVMDQLPAIVASGLGGGEGLGSGAKWGSDASGKDSNVPESPAAEMESNAFATSAAPSRSRFAGGENLDKDANLERPSARGNKADVSELAGRFDRGSVITEPSSEDLSVGDNRDSRAARPRVLPAKDAVTTPAPGEPSGHTWSDGGSVAFGGQVAPEGAKAPPAEVAAESLVLESRSPADSKPAEAQKNDLSKSEEKVMDSDSPRSGDNSHEPTRSNPAVTSTTTEGIDQMRRTLYTAEGNLNLGKYDEAKKAYQEALKIDPNNSAARRGIERVETAKSDYYRASYDHTRAELRSQVDSTWELSVPAADSALVDAAVPSAASKIEVVREFQYPTEYEPPAPATEPLPADEAKLLAELTNEIPAAETPYSTFSLNISDASFQLAKAALAKGERPDPASIKPEQFYNAVDYGDPAPASNEPVAATIEQSAHPVIPGRNLVRVALRTGSVGRSAVQPLRLTLLVDQSGSMVREDRRASMEHALAQLGFLLTKNDLVTVIGFSRTPHLLAEGKAADETLKLGELINQTASEGGTNLEEAMKLGGQLAERYQLAGAQNRIVLFTDGAANLGDANPARLAEQVKTFRQKGLAFDIAGIGADGLNDRLLSELARNGNGRYYVVGDEKNDSFARQLAGAFRPAAENVKVQVNFNPQRVGKYKLIGFEKDRLKTEDFRNDAVDAAELAAEEAGVAIYQVEPLAEGTGEIGEVSVRFRDAAGKEMVERTWTIPYESQATAFDRATPAMQLAGLSLLVAEKLKGGPLAAAIDFKQLTGPSAFVKQFYGSSPRVNEMLRVVDALK